LKAIAIDSTNNNTKTKAGDVAQTKSKRVARKRPRSITPERISVTLARSAEAPLFRQIREQVQDLIARGTLLPGMRLPPVRDLARQIGVNQITVAKAYRELAERHFIEGRRGGGSFVRAYRHQAVAETPAEGASRPLLADRLFELAQAPGVIAFSSNYPAVDEQLLASLRDSLTRATAEMLGACFRYDPPLGRPTLRREVQAYLARQGIEADTDHIMITSGAQQAIDVSVRALVPPGAPVIIEQPAYYGAINALSGARARLLEVPLEPDGMDLDVLERLMVRHQARLIYTNPTFQNPTGVTMSEAKRRALLALARKFGAVILEDDHSPELRFRGRHVPAIRAMADEEDLLLYARGFGKVLLPGMRIGYLVVPDALRQRVLSSKVHADLHCNSFMQEVVADFLAKQDYAACLERTRKTYGDRQRLLHRSLVAGMPEGTTVNYPEGGLSLWVTLPNGADVSELYFRAVRRGVAFVSGDVFHGSPSERQSLRVSFGLNQPEELEEGVARLCSVVKDLLGRPSTRNLLTV
jgi:2-aminoadipate transaminase